jgi:hypothetical protein
MQGERQIPCRECCDFGGAGRILNDGHAGAEKGRKGIPGEFLIL